MLKCGSGFQATWQS